MKKDRKQMPNVPNLRFPEFEGKWEKYKTSDLLEFFSTNSLSWDQLEYKAGELYNLHYGLIHKGLPTQVELGVCALPNIKKEFIPNSYIICKEGDIAFADASEDTNDVAKVIEFLNCDKKNLVCGLHTIHGRDKLNLTIKGFKGYAFSSTAFRNQIRRLAQGTKIYSVSTRNFTESFIGIPSQEEQAKIASLMLLIDKRIETQNKIIEDLKSLIKVLAHSLIKKKSNNVKLKNCLNCHSSTFMENMISDNNRGIYPVYGATGIIGYTDENIIDNDSILIIKDGASVGKVQYAKGQYSVISTLNYLTAKDEIFLKYIFYCLQLFSFEKYKVGSGIPHIYFRDYGDGYIYCPSIEKQKRIADILSSINNKIEIEKKMLMNRVEQKKYLLGNLFM